MDVSGENQIDVDHNLFKQRLTLQGEKIEDEPEKQGINSLPTIQGFIYLEEKCFSKHCGEKKIMLE